MFSCLYCEIVDVSRIVRMYLFTIRVLRLLSAYHGRRHNRVNLTRVTLFRNECHHWQAPTRDRVLHRVTHLVSLQTCALCVPEELSLLATSLIIVYRDLQTHSGADRGLRAPYDSDESLVVAR